MSALQKLKRKSKGAKAKTVKPGPKDPPPALDNSDNTTHSLTSGSVISVREATAVYKQDNVSQNDYPRDDTTVLDQTDPQPSTSQTNPSLHNDSQDVDNQITQSSTRFAPEPGFRQRISSATMETVVQPAHSTSSDQLVPFAAAELNNAHAYVPYLYARDSVAKVVADMKKMKANHIHFVDQIELRYGKIEEESQAQFNTFVVNLGQSYGKKVKTFRQVIDVHRIELQQKQEYWDAALVSLGGTNKQLLNEKKKLLIRNKLDHEYAENEIENSLKHLTVKLDEANALIADLREKEHKLEKEKEEELHEMEKNVKDECEKEKQEIQDEVIHLRKIVAELKKNPNSAAAVSIATASVAMDNSRDETRTLKAEVEETVQPHTYIETTARAPAVVISDLSEEERQKMEDERNEMKEERQKMKKERAAMDKEMEKFIANRNSLQQQRTDLEEQLILANKDKEIWKTKYDIIYARHKDANNLRKKYDLLKAKFDTAVLVASVSTDGEREKAEEEMRKAEQDKLIMDEEKLDLEKDFDKWEKDFKRQYGRKSEVNDRPEATQELFQNCQDADHKVNVLDAKIMTIQSLMNGEVPRSPEIEPEEVKVAEPVVTVIEVAVPDTQLQVELEMTQMELDATKRQILALQSDSTAQMDSMALLKAELSDSEHETNKLKAMQNELERQLLKVEQDLIRAKQAKPETVAEARQKDLIVQQRLKVDPELTEAKETEPVSSVEIQHPNQPLQRAEENLHSLDVAASVQMEIDAAELEIEALKRQINALQDQLIDKEHTLEEKEEQLKDKDHEILTNNRKHEEELREKDKKIKDMEKDIRKLVKHMAKLKKQLAQESKEPVAEDKADDQLEDRVTDLEKQILDVQGENKGLSAEKKILETNNKDLENKIVELRQELKALRKQGVVRREPSSVRREPSAVAAISASANTDSGRQMRKQEKLLKELEKLLDMERKKTKKNSDNMKKVEEEMRDVQKDNKDKENEIQKLKAELVTLGVSAAEAIQMSKEIKKLKRDVKKLGDENKTLGDNFNSERVLRKKYYNMVEDMKGKIRVYCRVRPMSKDEIGRGNTSVVKSADEYTVSVNSRRGTKEFQFDTIFMPESTQDKVFEDTHNLIQSAVDGYNVCIFAYGQTGSGKTFTIIGDREQAHPGIAPRAFTGMFDLLKENKSKFSYKVTCYMLELYNDKLVDLFSSSGHHLDDEKLVIKKDNKGLVVVQGAEIKTARNDKELFALFQEGSKTRHTASTKMNAESSRSHLVIGILIETTNKATGTTTKGKLSLVDLAGSERAGKTEASAEQLKEAMSINKSLSALGDVISALSSEQQFIPYRNNKLTMLMQDSLGGNAKTLMFVNISPADYNQDESVVSLMYASRVKLITNDAQKNADNMEISRLKAVIAKFKKGDSATDDADG